MTREQRVETTAERRRRYRRITFGTLALMLALAVLLPLGGYVYVGIEEARAQSVEQTNPRANYWREVRRGSEGYTSVQGQETGVLIHDGQNWRQIRNGYIANYGGWFLGAVLAGIVLFFAVRRTIKLDNGRSGRKIMRWSAFDRSLHWFTATLFFILAVTGLSMLFGRFVLIPVLGAKGFAAWAELAIWLHNNLGPVFGAAVVVMIMVWIRHNALTRTDLKWFGAGGGVLTKAHPDAGFLNGGEKMWFWFIATVGLVVIASGVVMNFPNWDFTRDQMQLANMIHGVTSLAWIGLWLGHAYIGTIGTEGALEGMTSGYVDEEWAKQHHNLWHDDVKSGAAGTGGEAGNDDATIVKGSPA